MMCGRVCGHAVVRLVFRETAETRKLGGFCGILAIWLLAMSAVFLPPQPYLC